MKREGDARERLLLTATELLWQQSYGSVSVDDICERAALHKGSFYHFFPSKSALAVAAMDDHWERNRADKDRAFSAQTAPLERLSAWCALIRRNQRARRERFGKVLGCPFSSMGSELGTQDENIRRKSQDMAERTQRYVESAVRDAAREGLIRAAEPGELAREIYSYVTGVLQQARIENDLARLKDLDSGIFRLLGVREGVSV